MAFDRTFLKTAREQLGIIDSQVAELQKQRTALSTLLGGEAAPAARPKAAAKPRAASATQTPTATSPASATPASVPASGVPTGAPGVKRNYIGHAIPEMARCGGTMGLAAIRTYIASLPGFAGVTSNNLNAAIQHELRKGTSSRLTRIEPGVYGLTEAGYATLSGAGEAPESEGEGEAAEATTEVRLPNPLPEAPAGASGAGY